MTENANNFDLVFLQNTLNLIRARRQLLENTMRYEDFACIPESNPGQYNLDQIAKEFDSIQTYLFHKKIMNETIKSARQNLEVLDEVDKSEVSSEIASMIEDNTWLYCALLGNGNILENKLGNRESIENKLFKLKEKCIQLMDEIKSAVAKKHSQTVNPESADDRSAKMHRALKKMNLARMLIDGLIASHISDPDWIQQLEFTRRDLTPTDFAKTWKVGFAGSSGIKKSDR